MNITLFKASNGWLRSFKRRFNITFKSICGESNDVDENSVALWKTKLNDICDGYEPCNIANCDETALFYRVLPNKILSVKNERCAGGKLSKERITVMLTVFGDGSIMKPLVIGKSANPKCFKKLDKTKLGVEYYSNKKAWMTGSIFHDYISKLNQQMKLEKRKILLFLDNAASHPEIEMSNVKLIFLPPNTTSRLQPLDNGIIRCLKVNYRKLMLQNLLLQMEASQSASEITRNITILDAINVCNNTCLFQST